MIESPQTMTEAIGHASDFPVPLIFHHSDNDGFCSAAIVAQYERGKGHKRCKCVKVNYDTFLTIINQPQIQSMLANLYRKIYLVDFNPRPCEMDVLLHHITDWKNQLVWIDHHEKAQNFDYFNLGIPGLRAFHQAACANCWNYLYPKIKMPDIVKYISRLDMGLCELDGFLGDLHFFLSNEWVEISNPQSLLWAQLLSDSVPMDKIRSEGYQAKRIMSRFFAKTCKDWCFQTTLQGRSVFAINGGMFEPQLFQHLKQSYDIVCRFAWTGKAFIVSLFSDKVDVGEIALQFDGGGHVGAAGFFCDKLPEFLKVGEGND